MTTRDLLGDIAQNIVDDADQRPFWERQAGSYSSAPMTNDNAEELAGVENLCLDFVDRGYTAEDVFAFGGANGCRDPKIVVETLRRCGQRVERIVHNDLAENLVEEAVAEHLSAYPSQGIIVQALAGCAHEIAISLDPKPRRVIIGLYSAEAFIFGDEGSRNQSGFAGYLCNHHRLGDEFLVQPLRLVGARYEDMGECFHVKAKHAPEMLPPCLGILRTLNDNEELGAIRVIGQHADQEGHFLSHWFTRRGVSELTGACFSRLSDKQLSIQSIPKGFLLCIDPAVPPRGIITLLNNVLGNIAPHWQAPTLRAIDLISA